MIYVLDTGILGRLCHPRRSQNRPVGDWLKRLIQRQDEGVRVALPEIGDYELRRKLLHLVQKNQASPKSIARLNDLAMLLEYLPLDTNVMRKAAELWAEARLIGLPTAADPAIDGDVILAAQAFELGATVVTSNRKHLNRFVPCKDWDEIDPVTA